MAFEATDAAACAATGVLQDLNKLQTPTLFVNSLYFDQNAVKQLSYGSQLYYVSGNMNMSAMDWTMVTVFYRNSIAERSEFLVEALGSDVYGDPYKMVESGQWTLANLLKLPGSLPLTQTPLTVCRLMRQTEISSGIPCFRELRGITTTALADA